MFDALDKNFMSATFVTSEPLFVVASKVTKIPRGLPETKALLAVVVVVFIAFAANL